MTKKLNNGDHQHDASRPAKGTNEAGPTASRSRFEGFLRLSRTLTAHELDPELAVAYWERTQRTMGSQLDVLVDRFEELVKAGRDPIAAVREDIFPDGILGATAKTILLLWYTGGIQNPVSSDWEMESSDQYYRALVWKTIGAHPPTLSNGYFGHWKYPPEM